MATYSTNEFRSGLKILLDGDPCVILENEFVKPGKGQAFNRVRIRNLKTGRVNEKTFKSGESVESADVVDTDMQYLYYDGEFWHFMVPDSFEQYAADANVVGDTKEWLKEQDVCQVTLWNNQPLLVAPPNFVELKIVETDPGVRGDTATIDRHLRSLALDDAKLYRALGRAALELDPSNDEAKYNLELALQRARGLDISEGAGGKNAAPGGAGQKGAGASDPGGGY